eukprot:CAMPEP_0185724456 /NCGR_PEP_ID=MMETSP1171-20130828/932_1 /TAXON_ID=374046 /ORGANISM="Helicotheca tamensis, Strain CCMP826" /LENGTH=276 /DNA_ID=CAMNT_0028392309 /DNA_START=250 /DNA_END=1080 /DNA_ORIENTATION=-
MVFGEMITGGHYIEVLQLGKQMAVGRAQCPSYWSLHKSFVSETGFFGAFYRGFLPWGMLQCLKGLPVLFVQNESMYQLRKRAKLSEHTSERISGFFGGAAQALVVCPTQKIKVMVVASPYLNSLPPLQAIHEVVRANGVGSLYDGFIPMMLRRSLDWGIRFTVSAEVKNYMMNQRRATNKDDRLALHELIICGMVGGAFSALTHPIDNIITNAQKPMPNGTSRDLISVVQRMIQESGGNAFTRGFAMRLVDNAYHMGWMYGVGTVAYEYLRRILRE